MNISRIFALGAGVALAGASILLVGEVASAQNGATAGNPSDYVAGVTFPAETNPYAAGWFLGNIANPGTLTSTAGGLAITGAVQLLNGTPGTGDLSDLADNAGLVNTGNAYFQISLYANGAAATGFTTLYPIGEGDAGLTSSGRWTTSQAITGTDPGSNGTAYVANAAAPLADLEAALGTDYQLLAYGAIVPAGDDAVISSITWNGTTHRFTPQPVATVTPTTISVADFSTAGKGVTLTATGFIPNESVQPGIGFGQSGGDFGNPVIADANGRVTFTYVNDNAQRQAAPGAGTIGATGATSGVFASATFTVIADPAAGGGRLASTGIDATPLLATGGALVLVGMAFGAISIRRRTSKLL